MEAALGGHARQGVFGVRFFNADCLLAVAVVGRVFPGLSRLHAAGLCMPRAVFAYTREESRLLMVINEVMMAWCWLGKGIAHIGAQIQIPLMLHKATKNQANLPTPWCTTKKPFD